MFSQKFPKRHKGSSEMKIQFSSSFLLFAEIWDRSNLILLFSNSQLSWELRISGSEFYLKQISLYSSMFFPHWSDIHQTKCSFFILIAHDLQPVWTSWEYLLKVQIWTNPMFVFLIRKWVLQLQLRQEIQARRCPFKLMNSSGKVDTLMIVTIFMFK